MSSEARVFTRMWSETVGDFVARCDFDDLENEYRVLVVHVPTLTSLEDKFKMTCWTKPIFNLMEVVDGRISRDMAEKLAVQLEETL